MKHSKIGASSMSRWAVCPGSVRLSEGIPSVSSIYAAEGTLAHDIAADILEGKPLRPCEAEMLEAILVYTDFVFSHKSTSDRILIEHRFDLSSLHPSLFGTADCVLYSETEKLLRVIDYKHGSGIAVEVQKEGRANLQLAYYGLGALISTGFKASEIELVIVQPRCAHPEGPIRRHRMSALELLDFSVDLVEAARRTEDPEAALVPGEHCRFCPAAGVCPELHKNAIAIAKQEFTPVFSYDPEKLANTLEWLPTLEAWVKSVREFAYREAEHGRTPPGWKLVEKRATRKWRDESHLAEIARLRAINLDLLFENTARSPAQVEKLVGKKEFQTLLADQITQESSGFALAHESDKRPAARLTAMKAFQDEDLSSIL